MSDLTDEEKAALRRRIKKARYSGVASVSVSPGGGRRVDYKSDAEMAAAEAAASPARRRLRYTFQSGKGL